MAGILESMGYRQADAELEADLVLYNTCTIRDNAEQKVTLSGSSGPTQAQRPQSHLIVAVAQQEGNTVEEGSGTRPCDGSAARQSPETPLRQVHSGQQVVATEEHHILEDITMAAGTAQSVAGSM